MLKNRIYYISVAVLLIIYTVGVVGLHTTYKDNFIELTPVTLLLSFFLLVINHRKWHRFFVVFMVFSMLVGFFVEVIGVEYGFIFGSYSYGETLGYKIFNVPVIIGVNWFVLTYSSGMIANFFRARKFIKVLIGATLMVLIDVSLEPVAIAFDFWSWDGGHIPIRNYVAWFMVAAFLHYFFQDLKIKKSNRLAIILFITQWIFFFTLSLTV
jgi:putative membrane protein